MHVRVARFEGIDTANVDGDMEAFRTTLQAQETPEWISEEAFSTLRGCTKRVMFFVDRDAGTSLDLIFTENAGDAQRVHEIMDAISEPEGAGRRTSVETYELVLDENLG